jgi:hypothetical protein
VRVVDDDAERARDREVRAEPLEPVQDRERGVEVRRARRVLCSRPGETEQVGSDPGCTLEQLGALRARGLDERRLEELADDAEGELALQLGRT